MEFKWVKEKSDNVEASDLNAVLNAIDDTKLFFFAYQTDAFLAGRAEKEQLGRIAIDKLLELRLFDVNQEKLYVRSVLGAPFSYRLASEKETELSKEYYIEMFQTIDINDHERKKRNYPEDGYKNMEILTTVNGRYHLPITKDEDTVKIIAYIDYDENGMAKVMDHRVCAFCKNKMAEMRKEV